MLIFRTGKWKILWVVMAIIILSGCEAPIQTQDIRSNSLYKTFNRYVEDHLSAYFFSVFPESVEEISYSCEYRYCYDCALLGDPNYYVYFKTNYYDVVAYNGEVKRLLEFPHIRSIDGICNTSRVILFEGTEEALSAYFDTSVEDGLRCVALLVIINDNRSSITYLYMDQYDSSPHKPDIVNYFEWIGTSEIGLTDAPQIS